MVANCEISGQVLFQRQDGRVDFVDMNGNWIRNVNIASNLGDIAMTPNGNLFGVSLTGGTLFQYNAANGALVRQVQLSQHPSVVNALSALDNNTLLFGSPGLRDVWTVNVNTGAVVHQPQWFPAGFGSAGDFFSLGGGDLLAVGTPNGGGNTSTLFILHENGTQTTLGTVPQTFGAARIGRTLYLGLADGRGLQIPDYTALQPSNGPIATQPFYNWQNIWGATATSETEYCPVVNPAQNTGDQGTPVTLTPTYPLGMDPAQAEFAREGQPAGSTWSADGKTLTVPGEGVWQLQPDGSAVFTPDPALVGNPTPVLYSTNDGAGNSAPPAELSVFYPDVSDVSAAGTVGQPVTVPADLGEGVDPTSVFFPTAGQPANAVVSPDGQTITVPGEGVWTIDPTTGAMTFTPDNGFTGSPESVVYSAALTSDPNATAEPANVSVTYAGVFDVTNSGDQGQPVSVPWDLGQGMDPSTVQMIDPATGNPTDGPLVVPGEGTWTIDQSSGSFVFTPEAGFTENPTPIEYTAQDNDGNQGNTATVTVTYPDVVDLTGSGDQGQPVDVEPNLPEGMDPTTVQIIDPATGNPTDGPVVVPGEGTWTVDPDSGVITFTPEAGFQGDPTPIEYTAADGDGNLADPATVTVTYPDVVDLTGSGDQGQPVDVQPNLPAGMDPTTVQIIDPTTGNPTDGPVVVPGEGTWSVDPTTGVITFTPEAGFQGDPTPIEYTAADGDGNLADPATVTVSYPNVVDLTGSGDQGQPVDVEPNLPAGMDPTTVQIIDPATGNPTDGPVVVPGEGTWSVDPDSGVITFTPEDGFTGNPTPIEYTAQDNDGNQADPATVTVSYPDVVDLTGNGPQGEPVDVEPNLPAGMDPTTVQLIDPTTGNPTDGPVVVPGEGTWTVDPDTGVITFTPEDGFTGNPTPIEYTAADNDGNVADPATVTVLYPDVVDLTGSGSQGQPVDVDPNLAENMDPTTVQLIDPATGNPTDGPVEVPGEGTWSVDPDTGVITFTPEDGFAGDPTPIEYTAADGDGNLADPATVTVTYPDIVDLTGNGDQGQPVDVDPNLPEGMDPTTVQIIDPATGNPTDGPVVVPGEGTWSVDPDTGVITFTPEDGFQGDPTPVQYTAADGDGNLADPANVTVTYPDVVDLTGSGDQGQPVDVEPNLPAGMDPTTVQIIDPATGNPTDGPVVVPGEGTWTVDPDTGVITFTPEDGFQGDPTPITYTAQDGDGNVAEPGTVTVSYPDVVDLTGQGNQGQPVDVDPNLPEGMDPTTVQIIDPTTGNPTDGPVVVPGEGTWTVDPDTGVITFTPEDGFEGDPTPIEYTAQDGDGNVAEPGTVTVTYPDLFDLTGDGDQGQPVDVDPNLPEGMDPTTVQIIDPNTGQPTDGPVVVPGEGTWTVDPDTGVITFTPEDGFQGDPTPVQYTAQDENGNVPEPGTVTVTYPDVVDLTGSGDQGQPVPVDPNLPEGMDPTTVQVIDPNTGQPTSDPVVVPGEGTWTVDPDTGVITFTPEDGFEGDPTPIEYTAEDENGNVAEPGTITVTYPNVVDLTGNGDQGQPVDVDPNLPEGMDPTTVQVIDPNTGQPTSDPVVVPGEGTWTVDPDTGVITFTPEDGFQGDPTPIEYTAQDGDGNVAEPGTVTVSYPDVVDLTGNGDQGQPVDVDPNLPAGMDPTTVQIIDPNTGQPTDGPVVVPGEGTWTVDPDTGVITFTPEDGFTGDPTPIEYTAQDDDGNVAEPGTVTVSYPDVVDLTGDGPQGEPVDVDPNLPEGMDPTTVQIIDPNTGEPTRDPVVVPGEGTWTVDPDTGVITFTPEDGFEGDPTPIEYTAEDEDGNVAEPGTVTIEYPDVPDITTTGPQGDPVTVTPDLDPGMDPTTIEIIDPNTGQPTTDPVVVPGEGTWTVDPDGDITFTPEDGFEGDPTPIEYIGTDENGNPSEPGTITIEYPDVPDIEVTTPPGVPVVITPDLPDNVDPGTIEIIDPNTGEPTTDPVVVPGEGTWTVDPDGDIIFTPEDGFEGDPTPIEYIGSDPDGNPSLPGTITITVEVPGENPGDGDPGDGDPGDNNPGDNNPGNNNPGNNNPGNNNPGNNNPGNNNPGNNDPGNVGINTGTPDGATGPSQGLIATGGALALAALAGLGMLVRRRRNGA